MCDWEKERRGGGVTYFKHYYYVAYTHLFV